MPEASEQSSVGASMQLTLQIAFCLTLVVSVSSHVPSVAVLEPTKQSPLVGGARSGIAVQARLDSLLERTEAIGSKTIEIFEGRDDHLMYRSVRYGPVERQQSDLKYVFPLSPLLPVWCSLLLLYVTFQAWEAIHTSSPWKKSGSS